jgi:hypothetical protein
MAIGFRIDGGRKERPEKDEIARRLDARAAPPP